MYGWPTASAALRRSLASITALPPLAVLLASALATVLASVALVSLPAATMAANGGGGGQGGGQGGGGEGGGGQTTGSLYADLYVALRAENGTPILRSFTVPASEPGEAATVETCAQPVSYERVPGVEAKVNPVDGREVWPIPLQGDWLSAPPEGGTPAELEACEPQPAYAMFVKEVSLDRLNLTRTSEDVIASKTAAVEAKLLGGTAIGLDSAGRIEIDGVPIDAAPEAAAIYQSILNTGTIPGLPAAIAGPPAVVGPASSEGLNSQFDAWELAAAALGTAASKETPITIDTVLYYNRIIGFPAASLAFPPGWSVSFNRSIDPLSETELSSGEQFVDFSGFTYNRSKTFPGSVTWFDADTLSWKVSPILDKVPFTNIPADPVGDRTLTGIQAFAQMADDVRAAIEFRHNNETTPGFFMDRVGTDTTQAQLRSITDPAVSWSDLPSDVFETAPFSLSASLFNPWGGQLIEHGRVRVRIHAPAALAAGEVSVSSGGVEVPITADGNGDLTGWWGSSEGFSIEPGYKATTPFDVTVASGAPVGDYTVSLELVSVDAPAVTLATDEKTLAVHGNVPTVLWGDALPKLVTQGTAVKLPITVYEPAADANAEMQFSIAGPSSEPLSPETLKAGDVSIYGEAPTGNGGTGMVAMQLQSDGSGRLVGTWPAALAAGYNDVVWYMTVAQGAPEGGYHLEARLAGAAGGVEADMSVGAPEAHGQKPPGVGEDAPTLLIAPEFTLGSSVKLTFTTDPVESGVTFYYQLTVDGQPGAWTEADGATVSFADLAPGDYTLAAYATDAAGVDSAVEQVSWVVTADAITPAETSPIPSPELTPYPAPAPEVTPPPEVGQQTKARVTLHLRWLRHDRLRLTGSVYPPHDGRRLIIQELTRTGWVTVGKAQLRSATSHRSRYAATLPDATPGVYRAYLREDQAHLASMSHTKRARAESHVTLLLQRLPQERLRLSGAVTPPRDGEKVMLQLRTRTGWKTVASMRLRQAAGKQTAYRATFGHLSRGVYRAHYGGDAGYRPSSSAAVTVR